MFDYVPPHEDPGNNNPKILRLDAVLLNLNLTYGKPDQTFASGPAGFLCHKKELGDDIEYSTWNEHKGCTVMYMPPGAKNY